MPQLSTTCFIQNHGFVNLIQTFYKEGYCCKVFDVLLQVGGCRRLERTTFLTLICDMCMVLVSESLQSCSGPAGHIEVIQSYSECNLLNCCFWADIQ